MKSVSEVQCNLMAEWKEYNISDIGKVVTGNTPPKKDPENYGGELTWIKPPDLDKKMFISESEETISDIGRRKVRLLPKGSVLVSCIGNIGKLAISECELCTNQQINSIIHNKDIVDSVFLYYAIKRMRPYLEDIASSAVVPLLNKNDFSKVKITLPPLKTQKKIVENLERAEKLKEWWAEADELADEFLKSVFLDMFGDPIKNTKNWQLKRLKDICKITMGQSPPGESYNEKGEGIEFFQGKAEFTDKYPIVKKWTTQPSKFAKKSDILISVRAPVGAVNLSNIACCIGRGLAAINCSAKVNLNYLYAYFKYMEQDIANMGTGSTFKAITKNQLTNLMVPIPPIELQNQFAEIVKHVETLKTHQKQSKQQIDNLFNALMQKAFKGELTC